MQQRLKWDDIIGLVLFAVSVAFLGVSVYLCFSHDIWYDELFTMGLGNQSLDGLISVTARDVHPPLYYMLVKLGLFIGGAAGSVNQIVIAKLVSVLPFLLCIGYGITKVRKNFGWLSAGLFCFLILSMPQLPEYTVEVRMYGFSVFFITAGMLHGYELMLTLQEERHNRKYYGDWVMVTVYCLAACYTHYFACVAACMIYLYLLGCMVWQRRLRQEMKYLLVSGGLCAIAYLPWFVRVVTAQVGAVKESYWIQELSLRNLGGCVKFLFLPAFTNENVSVILAVLLIAFYGIVLFLDLHNVLNFWSEQEKGRVSFSVGCILVLAGIILFGFAASFLIRPVFVYRYMLPAMGVFWLAFAILLAKQKKRLYLFLPAVLLVAVIGLRDYRAFYGEEMWKKVQMAAAEEALAKIGRDDRILYNFDQTQAVVSYYMDNESFLWYGEPEALIREMYPKNHSLVEGEFSDEAGIANIKSWLSEGETVWFLGSGNVREEIREKWKKAGIDSEEKASVMIERYWFNIYALSLQED